MNKNTITTLLSDKKFRDKVKCIEKTFEPKEVILNEGETYQSFYFIKEGMVRVTARVSLGEEKRPVQPGISDLYENDIFGEFTIFDNFPASANVVAVSKTKIIEIDIESFKKYIESNPDIGFLVLKDFLDILINRLRHSNKTIVRLLAWGLKVNKIEEHL